MSTAIKWRGLDECRELFARLHEHVDEPTAILDFVGNTLTESTIERIADTKQDPEGTLWKPLNKKYAKYKSRHSSGGILEYTGNLLRSITYNVNVNDNEVAVGSHEEYAVYVHAERPFLGISDSDSNVINQYIRDVLNDD